MTRQQNHLRMGRASQQQTNIESTGKIDFSANEQLRTTTPDALHAMSVKCDEDPHDVASFFRKTTYFVRILFDIWSKAMLTVPSLADRALARV